MLHRYVHRPGQSCSSHTLWAGLRLSFNRKSERLGDSVCEHPLTGRVGGGNMIVCRLWNVTRPISSGVFRHRPLYTCVHCMSFPECHICLTVTVTVIKAQHKICFQFLTGSFIAETSTVLGCSLVHTVMLLFLSASTELNTVLLGWRFISLMFFCWSTF